MRLNFFDSVKVTDKDRCYKYHFRIEATDYAVNDRRRVMTHLALCECVT